MKSASIGTAIDPLREHGAYIETLLAVRGHFSLTHTATYLGSKPQNVAGWLAAQSVPTLKDFRGRIAEMAFFLQYVVEVPLGLGGPAAQIMAEAAPLLPHWGTSLSPVGEAQPKASTEQAAENWTQRIVNNVRELIPSAPFNTVGARRPELTWAKLTQLKQFYDKDKPRSSKPQPGAPQTTAVIIWGESCAGKSALANALLGAELFTVTPVPEHPRCKILSTPDRALLEMAGWDGPGPAANDQLQLLRYLFNSRDCRLFMVMAATAFPMIGRMNLLEQLAILPCKLNLVITKIDLIERAEDQEQVIRFLRGSFSTFRVYTTSAVKVDELTLNELRGAASLVGTARFQMVAAASATQDVSGDEHMLRTVIDVVREVCKIDQPVSATTTFHELGLTEPQIGAVLLAIESSLQMKFPDREADLALRGGESLGWLTNVVLPLSQLHRAG